jgi:hypothetical protein
VVAGLQPRSTRREGAEAPWVEAEPREPLDKHPVQIEIWRRQPAEQRLRLAMELSRQLVENNHARLRSLHPDWNERQLRYRWTELNYGASLAREVYGEP